MNKYMPGEIVYICDYYGKIRRAEIKAVTIFDRDRVDYNYTPNLSCPSDIDYEQDYIEGEENIFLELDDAIKRMQEIIDKASRHELEALTDRKFEDSFEDLVKDKEAEKFKKEQAIERIRQGQIESMIRKLKDLGFTGEIKADD